MATAPSYDELKAKDAALKAQARAKAFNEYQVRLHVDDDEWTFRAGDVTARHVGKLREATGTDKIDPVMNAITALHICFEAESPAPVDLVAQLVFLARLQAGERVSYEIVADSITTESVVWCEFPMAEIEAEEGTFMDPTSCDGDS